MSKLLIIIFFINTLNTTILFDFDLNCDISRWMIVDDNVMGGISSGKFSLSPEGSGIFEGTVSLENNGGFSSVRYRFDKTNIEAHSKFVIRIKGDGKRYQFRVKTNTSDYYSYVTYISTSQAWQTVEIPFNELYPNYRGRKLDQDNFSSGTIEEIGFLFGNKKAEDFKLEIDKIEVR